MASSNARAAYRRLRGIGLTPAQAAGAVGGLTGESGPDLNPNAVNPTSGAVGIGQWLGGRAKGVRKGDLQQQLSHLVNELHGGERGALAALKRAKGPREAAEIWTRTFERPSAGEIAASLPARQRAAQQLLAELHGEAPSSGSKGKDAKVSITGNVTPATAVPDRGAAVAMVLRKGSKGGLQKFGTSRLRQAQQVYDLGLATKKVPVQATQDIKTTAGADSAAPAAGGGTGQFKITGADPGRLKPELVSFARKVAGTYGHPLTGDSGATHSRLTVNGNVSEHSTGNATDIPATGKKLLAMGRAALIAAGMPRAQAMKQTGGLYNVGNHQIIFLTNQGGNHFDHLHISTHAHRR